MENEKRQRDTHAERTGREKNDRKICGFYCLSSTSFSQDLMSFEICLLHCIKGDKASYFVLPENGEENLFLEHGMKSAFISDEKKHSSGTGRSKVSCFSRNFSFALFPILAIFSANTDALRSRNN